MDITKSMGGAGAPSAARTSLDFMKEMAHKMIRRFSSSHKIRLFSLQDSEIMEISSGSDQEAGIVALEAVTHGTTCRWDALARFYEEELAAEYLCEVYLLTDDGKDQSKENNFELVNQLFSTTDGCCLHIVTHESENDWYSVIPPSDHLEMIGGDLLESLMQPPTSIEINAPIVCIGEGVDHGADIVAECMAEVVLQLEMTTGLVYRPALTVVAGKLSMEILHSNDSVGFDESLLQDLAEMLRLLQGGCLLFHSAPVLDELLIDRLLGPGYASVSSLSEYIVGAAAYHLLGEGPKYMAVDLVRHSCFLDGNLDLLNATLKTLGSVDCWLRELARLGNALHSPEFRHASSRYFETYGRFTIGGRKKEAFDLESWRRRLSEEEFETFAECFEDELLIKHPRTIQTSFELTRKIVTDLLPKAAKHYRARLIAKCRLYGHYVRSSKNSSRNLMDVLENSGLPPHLLSNTSGIVFISLDACSELASVLARGGDYDDAVRRVIRSILIHEHGHAILEQGYGRNHFGMKLENANIVETIGEVEEAIVEWIELDSSRRDPVMYRAISDHADAGDFPEWPYAGAMILERFENQFGLRGDCARTLLKHYRNGLGSLAMALIRKWNTQNTPC